jgi:hypothetical protein
MYLTAVFFDGSSVPNSIGVVGWDVFDWDSEKYEVVNPL